MFELLKKCLKDIEPLILIERLRTHLKPNETFENTLALQSSRLKDLENRERLHTIAQDAFVSEKNKIKLSLSAFIDDLTEVDFKTNYKDLETISVEAIEETIGFIQGHIEDLECFFNYYTRNGHQPELEAETENAYFTFEYLNGVGVIKYQETTKIKSNFRDSNYKKFVHIEIPFRELKSLELEIFKKDEGFQFYRFPIDSTSHLQQICFYVRNRKEAIIVSTYSLDDDGLVNVYSQSRNFYKEYRLTVINENITQRLVEAFKFLMEANGAKKEMF